MTKLLQNLTEVGEFLGKSVSLPIEFSNIRQKMVSALAFRTFSCFFEQISRVIWFSMSLKVVQATFLEGLGGTDQDEAWAIAPTSDGNFIVGGTTRGFGDERNKGLLAKIAVDGSRIWAKTWGGLLDDNIKALGVAKDEGIIAAGYSGSFDASKKGVILQKWWSNGTLVWANMLSGNDDLYALGVAAALDGGIAIAGSTGSNDFLVAKWNGEGIFEWAKTLGGVGNDQAFSIAATPDDGLFVVGFTTNEGVGDIDFLLAKWWSNGTLSWSATLGGSGSDYGYASAATDDGELFAIGDSTYSFGATSGDALLSKWLLNGTLAWAKTLGGVGYDSGWALALTPDGGMITGGYTSSFGAVNGDAIVSKWWINGSHAWTKFFGGVNEDSVRILSTNVEGEIFIGGITESYGSGGPDFLLAIMSNNGEIVDCSYLQQATPTVTDVTASINETTPIFDSQDLGNLTFKDLSNVTGVNISPILDLKCEAISSTTGVFTTGLVTTGETPTRSPSAKEVESSSPPSSDLGLVLGLTFGLGIPAALAVGVGGYALWRNRHKQAVQNNVEMQNAHSAGTLSPDRQEVGTIIGGKYRLVRKITRIEASELLWQTGVEIQFASDENKIKPLIGAGRFGKLRIAQNINDKQFVGVKKVKGESLIKASKNEAEIQKLLLGLPNIMPLLDSVETLGSNGQPVLYQFMPLAGFGSGDVMQGVLPYVNDNAIKRKLLGHVAKKVLQGLSGMQTKSISHLDLKLSNIVFDQTGEVFIIDFGCAVISKDPNNLVGGNGDSRYFSPGRLDFCREALKVPQPIAKQSSYSGIGADLWALGLMLIELMNNEAPFNDTSFAEKLLKWDAKFMKKQLEVVLNKEELAPFCDFIRQLLDAEEKKTTADGLLKDHFFKNSDYNFSNEAERSDAFESLKKIIREKRASQWVQPSQHPIKSEDQNYVQSHYTAALGPNVYENAADFSTTHTYVNS